MNWTSPSGKFFASATAGHRLTDSSMPAAFVLVALELQFGEM
jgi:hypothetical protein